MITQVESWTFFDEWSYNKKRVGWLMTADNDNDNSRMNEEWMNEEILKLTN